MRDPSNWIGVIGANRATRCGLVSPSSARKLAPVPAPKVPPAVIRARSDETLGAADLAPDPSLLRTHNRLAVPSSCAFDAVNARVLYRTARPGSPRVPQSLERPDPNGNRLFDSRIPRANT